MARQREQELLANSNAYFNTPYHAHPGTLYRTRPTSCNPYQPRFSPTTSTAAPFPPCTSTTPSQALSPPPAQHRPFSAPAMPSSLQHLLPSSAIIRQQPQQQSPTTDSPSPLDQSLEQPPLSPTPSQQWPVQALRPFSAHPIQRPLKLQLDEGGQQHHHHHYLQLQLQEQQQQDEHEAGEGGSVGADYLGRAISPIREEGEACGSAVIERPTFFCSVSKYDHTLLSTCTS